VRGRLWPVERVACEAVGLRLAILSSAVFLALSLSLSLSVSVIVWAHGGPVKRLVCECLPLAVSSTLCVLLRVILCYHL
jgi:hypothetical protein